MATDNKNFYKKQTASSLIKAKIVAEYFPQYCRIILKRPQPEIRYMDLFSGPGIYENGAYSTPMLVGQQCANDQSLKEKVQLAFNDKKYGKQLEANFCQAFPDGTFKHKPRFGTRTVGNDKDIDDYLSKLPENVNNSPTLLFFDPWGYKGIDTATLANFLGNWGNEIFLFINIKRIHAAIENDKFEDLMRSLFPKSFDKLKKDRLYTSSVHDRLNLIMNNIANEFNFHCKGKLYSCAFKFQEEDSKATSHYLIHFTKHPRGYELVKQIYYDFDNIGACLESEGVYTFDVKKMGKSEDAETALFENLNVLYLSKKLEEQFKGQRLTARQLFDIHQPSGKWCATHYAKTLRNMVVNNKIVSEFTDGKSHNVSVLITQDCLLTFK